jgi:hypothetical protein
MFEGSFASIVACPRHVRKWDGPAVLPPHQQAMLVRGTKARGLAIAEALKISVAVVGIDIGTNSFHLVGLDKLIVFRQKWSRGSRL